MKRNSITMMLTAILIVAMGLAGCASSSQVQSASQPSEQSADDQGKKTVADELGRQVEIPENPQRVLALTSTVMQALYNIDITPVGKVEEYKVSEEGMALPSVGVTSAVNIEAIYALQPDLIIASSRFHSAIEEELEKSGAAVFYFDPDKAGEIPLVEINPYVGNLLGRQELAEQYAQSLYALADQMKAKINSETDIKTGIIIQEGETIMAAQKASGYGSMLSLLAIENIVPEDIPGSKKASFVPFDVETIVASNPDLILIVTSTKDPASNQAILEKFRADSQWASLDAVKNNRLVILPFAVNPNRSTPETMIRETADCILKACAQ